MKFSVLAIDYDGTVARDGVMVPGGREALAALREKGVAIILATGRRLDDLRRVAGDLHFADAVVAENGAVVEFPTSGYRVTLGPQPPAVLLAEFARHGIPFVGGQVILEAEATDAPRMLAILREQQLPLVLLFNRGRVMLLPQAISKETGLKRALNLLRLSEHNAVGVGDAENDHALLGLCEVAAAAAWGSAPLRAAADVVVPGAGPEATPAFLRQMTSWERLPIPAAPRRHLQLGHADDGTAVTLAVRGRTVLVAGDPKSGKSWVAGLLAEQLIVHGYSLCILDAEGDYTSLESLPGVTVTGTADPLPRPREIIRALRHPDVSLVVNLASTPHAEKLEYIRTVLPAIATLRRETGLPHRIVVDEAHYFLNTPETMRQLDLAEGGFTFVTYRASELDPTILASTQAIVVTCESDPHEVERLFRLCASCSQRGHLDEWIKALGSLDVGEAVILPITTESGGELRRIRLNPRLTPHVRHEAKYIDIPVPPSRAFVFWRNGKPTGETATTVRQFAAVLAESGVAGMDGHLRAGDFSRWFARVFGDYPLARTIAAIERGYADGSNTRTAQDLIDAVRQRYRFVDEDVELEA